MEKLLHERLRDVENNVGYVYANGEKCAIKRADAQDLACEIERYYIPRPRFDDGEPVTCGCMTDMGEVDHSSVAESGYWSITLANGETLDEDDYGSRYLKRPTPKVYDADGVEIKVGDTVWNINNGCEHEVIGLPRPGCYQSVEIRNATTGSKGGIDAPLLTHERPVFDAEGVRICKGDEVWDLDSGEKLLVVEFANREYGLVQCANEDDDCEDHDAHNLTHREPDSSENIREDARKLVQSLADKYEDGDTLWTDSYCPLTVLEAIEHLLDRERALVERGA